MQLQFQFFRIIYLCSYSFFLPELILHKYSVEGYVQRRMLGSFPLFVQFLNKVVYMPAVVHLFDKVVDASVVLWNGVSAGAVHRRL